MLPGLSSSVLRHQRQTDRLLCECKDTDLFLNSKNVISYVIKYH